MTLVVVFDTNILFSGVGWRGRPYQCLELARVGVVEGVTCNEVLIELTEKLQTKLLFTEAQITDTLADLLTFLRVVETTGDVRVVQDDPDDDAILDCAVSARATHIVTGDRRHLLPLIQYEGIAIVSAADFLSLVHAE